jgi:hypothetical protein
MAGRHDGLNTPSVPKVGRCGPDVQNGKHAP